MATDEPSMLDEIRSLFRRSLAAFRDELEVREPEDMVAELLSAMRKEMVAARAAIPEYEVELARCREDLSRERHGLVQCERRQGMAERIGDAETARVAAQYAARHRDRVAVLEKKLNVAEAELALRQREADEMMSRFREVETSRFALVARLRRAGSRGRMEEMLREDTGPSAELDRMAERVERESSYVDALEELEDAPPADGESRAVEERLRELKRRLGRQ